MIPDCKKHFPIQQENVFEAELIMAAEDFSFMAQAAPGAFMRLGTHNPAREQLYAVHTSTLKIDEDAFLSAAPPWHRRRSGG